jgi:hypothetical protein
MYKVTIVQEVVVGGMVREENIIHLYFKQFSHVIDIVHAIEANCDNEICHTYCILSKDYTK